ncbi:putative PFY1-profilin [Syncephalis plumigaleata]|nr:putative PFY1-profilin [Syncephalis plumigaleata]
MSWDGYVQMLTGTGKIQHAAIFGHNGQQWATSEGFQVAPEEIQNIIAAFTNADNIRASGIRANGTKYFALECDATNLNGKQGGNGITCVKTNQAVVIGVYESPVVAGEANMAVDHVAKYLRDMNYVSCNDDDLV